MSRLGGSPALGWCSCCCPAVPCVLPPRRAAASALIPSSPAVSPCPAPGHRAGRALAGAEASRELQRPPPLGAAPAGAAHGALRVRPGPGHGQRGPRMSPLGNPWPGLHSVLPLGLNSCPFAENSITPACPTPSCFKRILQRRDCRL